MIRMVKKNTSIRKSVAFADGGVINYWKIIFRKYVQIQKRTVNPLPH
ncbi:hypothetical protein B879_03039 [Cecembia lonarensis LW9]|uniref:Uncharacterized protein n=1 Tax=Cecembia lonarensis (strain CCUG 58316 / KCTC 22772 / LW9) TaxID=1225176 RepID=K1KW32_CECL9|nr:hypothetical protein B879_03039 [Cecembia lonarensis LW9]